MQDPRTEPIANPDKRDHSTYFQFAGLAVAVLTIAVTVYFSIRSERSKALTITYLPAKALIATDDVRSSKRLEVRMDATVVKEPWIETIRVTNSGTIPIEASDVEAPLTLSFSNKANIAGTEVLSKTPASLYANVSASNNRVTVNHKLLNPTDSITFDVLFDGQPELPATLDFRISGVTSCEQSVISAGNHVPQILGFSLPSPATYSVVVLSSLFGFLAVITGIVGLGQEVSTGLKGATPRFKAIGEEEVSKWLTNNTKRSFALDKPTRVLHALVGQNISHPDCLEPGNLLALVEQNVSAAILKDLDLKANDAANMVALNIRNSFVRASAQNFYSAFPPTQDSQGRDEILKLDIKKQSLPELVDAIVAIAGKYSEAVRKTQAEVSTFKGSNIAIAGTLFVAGLMVCLVAWGTWINLFSHNIR